MADERQPTGALAEIDRETLRRIARIIGSSSAASLVLARLVELEAQGRAARVYRYGNHFLVEESADGE